MTTLKDISDTYDCDELHTNVSAWMKTHTPIASDINMYLIRLRTINHLLNYSDSPLIVETFEGLAAQLDKEQRHTLVCQLLNGASREENITFLSAISSASPAAERVLLAAWENNNAIGISSILQTLSRNLEYTPVLFSGGFLQSPDYIEFLRRSPYELFGLLINNPVTDEALERLSQTQLIHEELLFPLLSAKRQTYDSFSSLVAYWQKMFPEYVSEEATRIAAYLPSGNTLENFVSTTTLNARQKLTILLEWVGRPDSAPFTQEFFNVMNGVDWNTNTFRAFFNAYTIGQGNSQALEKFSVMWASNTAEPLHQYLHPYIVQCKSFSSANDWVRQKVILQHETQHVSTSKSQRKM